MSLLRVENVSFAYGRRPTLTDISLTLEPGRSLGLVGESGSGKTTLLRLILGLERPASGRILFDNTPVEPRNAAAMRAYRRNVQAVFQDPYSSLDPRQPVLRIVSEPLRALKIEGDHTAMVRRALSSVGLDPDILDRLPHEFSGGQRQRIAIARAIVARPRLLLADEAVSALDLGTRIRIIELFQTLATQMTLVFVSHDLGAVAALCDELAILEQGRLVEAGPTRTILRNPQHPYTQQLLGSVPRMPA
ncbi:MAG: ABC transporter ATP-binding protein [Devosia sp.]|nr:ABC transporter ATP-binding protein [Devosia sp.]